MDRIAAGTPLARTDIARGLRIAVTLKNGRRVSGTARSGFRTNRVGETYFTLSYSGRKGSEMIFRSEFDSAISLG